MRGLEATWEWFTKVSGASTYFKDFINAAYDNTVQAEDEQETSTKANMVSVIAPQLAAAHAAKLSEFQSDFFFDYLAGLLVAPSGDAGQAITYEYDATLLATGQVSISRRGGILGLLRTDMVANAQTIRQNVVTLGALAAASVNVGTLAEASITSKDHTLAGTLHFVCVDDTVSAVKLEVSLLLTTPLIDGTTLIDADNLLTVAKSFEDGPTGLGITLSLGSVVETGDGGGIFSATTVTNPAEADSTKGKHHFEVERMSGTGGNPDFRVRWYSDAGLTNLVATKDVTGVAGSIALTIPGTSSTIATTFDKTNAAAALPVVGDKDSDIVFDIKIPRLGDKWTKTVTNDESGNFATKIARRFRASLNSVANPGQTISDALASSTAIT